MAEYKISIIVDGQDKASKPLGAVGSALGRMGEIAGGIISAKTLMNIADGIIDIGRAAFDSVAKYERLGMALQSLTARELLNDGTTESMAVAMDMASGRAKELQGWITKLAIKSPFTQAGVADAFRMAMAYGFTTKEAQRLTTAMIDFAAGTGASEDSMSRIALALGQIKARGKLAGSEVLQLVNAGLDVRGILAKAFGVTTKKLMDMQQRGIIPADKAIQAIVQSLEHDFGGAAEASATNFSGLVSSLSDIKEVDLREFFQGTFDAIKPGLIEIVDLLSSEDFTAGLRAIGQTIGEFIVPAVDAISNGITVISAFVDNVTRGVEPTKAFGYALATAFGAEKTLEILSFFDMITAPFSGFVTFAQEQGPVLQEIFSRVFGTLGEILLWLGGEILNWFVEQVANIGKWFADNGPLISSFLDVLLTAVTNIIGVIANMWQFVAPVLTAIINIILDIAKAIMLMATGDWTSAWNMVETIVNDAVDGIKGFLEGFANWVLETFVGSNLKEFENTWGGIFSNISIIASKVIEDVKKFFDGLKTTIDNVVGSVRSLIDKLLNIKFPKLPSWLERHSPAPIEIAFGNWLEYAKELKTTMNSIDFPQGGMAFANANAGQNTYDNRREYHLHISTTQSPAVVQQSFDLMRVLDYGS